MDVATMALHLYAAIMCKTNVSLSLSTAIVSCVHDGLVLRRLGEGRTAQWSWGQDPSTGLLTGASLAFQPSVLQHWIYKRTKRTIFLCKHSQFLSIGIWFSFLKPCILDKTCLQVACTLPSIVHLWTLKFAFMAYYLHTALKLGSYPFLSYST